MIIRIIQKSMIFSLLLLSSLAHAALDINLNSSGQAQKTAITIARFTGETGQQVSQIVAQDLLLSGQFDVEQSSLTLANNGIPNLKEIKTQNAPFIVVGHISDQQIFYTLIDGMAQKKIKQGSIPLKEIRHSSHQISNDIYESITGTHGVFLTQITYVSGNNLYVSDFDGYNQKIIFESNQKIISPAWSPDGQKIAYVSFESHKPVVYIQGLRTGERFPVANFKGNNSAPTWSADGQSLAVALSLNALSNIYMIDANKTATSAKQLTFSTQIDTEPSLFPNGSGIIFTSDRSGSPQLYRSGLYGGMAQRITFTGNQNLSPDISPDGKKVVYSSLRNGRYSITTHILGTSVEKVISPGPNDLSPSFAPNSTQIIFVSDGKLGIANTLNGSIFYLTNTPGQITSVDWGPYVH